MSTNTENKLASLTESELRNQTINQYRAVCHMAKSLIEVHDELIPLHAPRGVMEMQCERSAQIMEMMGETLNAMDAVDDKQDAWMTPVFAKAHQIFGDNMGVAPEITT